MKEFARGLIVGKFSPLHCGHEFLIRSALEACAELVVLAYGKPRFPGCEPEKQERWFKTLFPGVRAFVLRDDNIQQLVPGCSWSEIPDEARAEEDHRVFVAEVYTRLVGLPLDAIFTSEDYGPPFTERVNKYFSDTGRLPPRVVHRMVDKSRVNVPVSGTKVRGDYFQNRKFLSPAVYRDFVKRIVFFGAESTGKTTIAEYLAGVCGSVWVPEYGRELWIKKGGKLEFDDLVEIARVHTAQEDAALMEAREFLFIDTSPLTTLFYCLEYFGKAADELRTWAKREYDYVFLCMPDIPFVQDETRADEVFRQRQHEWYLRELKERRVKYMELWGSLEQRGKKVLEVCGKDNNYH